MFLNLLTATLLFDVYMVPSVKLDYIPCTQCICELTLLKLFNDVFKTKVKSIRC